MPNKSDWAPLQHFSGGILRSPAHQDHLPQPPTQHGPPPDTQSKGTRSQALPQATSETHQKPNQKPNQKPHGEPQPTTRNHNHLLMPPPRNWTPSPTPPERLILAHLHASLHEHHNRYHTPTWHISVIYGDSSLNAPIRASIGPTFNQQHHREGRDGDGRIFRHHRSRRHKSGTAVKRASAMEKQTPGKQIPVERAPIKTHWYPQTQRAALLFDLWETWRGYVWGRVKGLWWGEVPGVLELSGEEDMGWGLTQEKQEGEGVEGGKREETGERGEAGGRRVVELGERKGEGERGRRGAGAGVGEEEDEGASIAKGEGEYRMEVTAEDWLRYDGVQKDKEGLEKVDAGYGIMREHTGSTSAWLKSINRTKQQIEQLLTEAQNDEEAKNILPECARDGMTNEIDIRQLEAQLKSDTLRL